MKIYTEEQLQEAYNRGHMDGRLNNTDYSITDGFKPIELPSDEEIKSYSNRYSTMHEDVSDKLGKYLVSAIHIDGANWIKGQLYDGVRLKRFIKDEAEQILNQKYNQTNVGNDGFEFDNSSTIPPTKGLCDAKSIYGDRELTIDERMHLWFVDKKPNRDVCDSVDELSDEEKHKYFDECNITRTIQIDIPTIINK